MNRIARSGSRISFQGQFLIADILHPLVAMYQAVDVRGYRDLVLDFSGCSAAFPAPMLALCAQVMRFRKLGIDIELVWPRDETLGRLFRNANWAHLLCPRNSPPSTFRGHTQVPATHFATADRPRPT